MGEVDGKHAVWNVVNVDILESDIVVVNQPIGQFRHLQVLADGLE